MTPVVRVGWALTAVAAGAIASSLLHVAHTGPVPVALLVAIAAVSLARPRWGLALLAGVVPIAFYSASQLWNVDVAWAEAVACAALAGLGLEAARGRGRVPGAVAWPAAVFTAVVGGSLAATLRVMEMREGTAFWGRFAYDLTHVYLTNYRLTPINAGFLLLEGLLLFAHAARVAAREATLRLVCGGLAIGTAVAAACTLHRLADAAARAPAFWRAVLDLALTVRLNVHYADMNAAGSFYALALLAICGAMATSAGGRRIGWAVCAVLAVLGLWLTSSRVALLAAPAGLAMVVLLPRALGGGRRPLGVIAIGAAVCATLALLAVTLPQRGIQQSSLVSADVRVGLIRTGLRMIRAYPAFGIGLGEFYPNSAHYSSPALLAQFPVIASRGENAHNNFIQIAAETEIAGGLAFAWTLAAALLLGAHRAMHEHDRLLRFVLAGLVAFVLTMMGGHPLLVPEAAYIFWLIAGTAAGAGAGAAATAPVATSGRRRWKIAAAAALAAVVLTVPLRIAAAARDANLEHVAIGMSLWRVAPDGIRYREATGDATIYVPDGAIKFSVSPQGAAATLQIVLDGRVADVRDLVADRWTDIVIPARTVESESRFRRMDLRTTGPAHPPLRVTKTEPILSR